MFIKPLPFVSKIPLLWQWQLVLVALAGSLFIMGDHSHPKLIQYTAQPSVNGTINFYFDRPINKDLFNRTFHLSQQQQAIAGSLSWSTTSVAFIPKQPLGYSTTYQARFELADLHNPHNSAQLTKSITTNPSRFVYLDPQHQLQLYDLDRHTSQTLSRANEYIYDYDVSPNGTILVSYSDSDNQSQNGLYTITLNQRNQPTYTNHLTHKPDNYLISRYCQDGQTIILYASHVGGTNAYKDNSLLIGPAFAGQPDTSQLRSASTGTISYPNNNYVCPHHADYYIKADLNTGNAWSIPFNGGPDQSLGPKRKMYQFSPTTDKLVMSYIHQIDQTSLQSVLILDPEQGSTTSIDSPYFNLSDPDINQDESTIILVQNSLSLGNDLQTSSTLAAYATTNTNTTIARSTTSYDHTYQLPKWSTDGQFIAFQSIDNNIQAYPVISNDNQDNPLYGQIMVGQIKGTTITTTPLALEGGHIIWLP